MKSLLTAAALVFSISAYATPKVGDHSEFAFSITHGTETRVGTYTSAIVSENGEQVSLSTTIHFDGQEDQHSEEPMNRSQLLNDETIADVLANCAEYGGAAEQLVVPAGTFPSCKLAMQDDAGKDNGFMWIGTVPFGILKQVMTNPEGVVYDLQLSTFVNGQ